MGRGATKAAGNPWYQARIRAADWNERLSSRAGAAEMLNVSEDVIISTENDKYKQMPAETAIRMADLYNAPELLNCYCKNNCLIGRNRPISDEIVDIDRVTVRIPHTLKALPLRRLEIPHMLKALVLLPRAQLPMQRAAILYLHRETTHTPKVKEQVHLTCEQCIFRDNCDDPAKEEDTWTVKDANTDECEPHVRE